MGYFLDGYPKTRVGGAASSQGLGLFWPLMLAQEGVALLEGDPALEQIAA